MTGHRTFKEDKVAGILCLIFLSISLSSGKGNNETNRWRVFVKKVIKTAHLHDILMVFFKQFLESLSVKIPVASSLHHHVVNSATPSH